MAASAQELEVREKKELLSKDEKTVPARYFVPSTDIHETEDALIVVMEVPGVDKKDIAVDLKTTFSASMHASTPANTRAFSRFIPNTMSVTSRGPSRCRPKSISSRSERSLRMVC
jgi:HSP20 family molecular chaperone IbpA